MRRTLALSLGSIQMLEWLRVWQPAPGADRPPPSHAASQAITEVHVSQQAPALGGALGQLLEPLLGKPEVRIRAADEGVGAARRGAAVRCIVAPLQRAWLARCEAEPQRLSSRFGRPVAALKQSGDRGRSRRRHRRIVRPGGGCRGRRLLRPGAQGTDARLPAERLGRHGRAARRAPGVAYERFTRHGPVALLPLRNRRAALVWCVDRNEDPVAGLDDRQRRAGARYPVRSRGRGASPRSRR